MPPLLLPHPRRMHAVHRLLHRCRRCYRCRREHACESALQTRAASSRPSPLLPPRLAWPRRPQKESAGYRLLAAMGWKEGEGLGASKQGIKSHIKVKKKFENWGVGAVRRGALGVAWGAG